MIASPSQSFAVSVLPTLLLACIAPACQKGPPSFADVDSGKIAMVDTQVEAIRQLLTQAKIAPEAFAVAERPRQLSPRDNGVEVQRGQAVVLVLRGNKGLRRMLPIAALGALERLDLSNNALDRVEGLQFSGFLAELHLDGNQLVSLGKLGGLYGLKTLTVAHNELKTLDGIEELMGLEVLDAAHNRIVDPGPLIGLPNLREVDLSHNRLDEEPGYLDHIPRLGLTGNPLAKH